MPQEPQSETPRTDDLKRPAGTFDVNDLVVSAKFMAQQERELREAKKHSLNNFKTREALEDLILRTEAFKAANNSWYNNQSKENSDLIASSLDEYLTSADASKQILGLHGTASIIVLSRAEVEKLPCGCRSSCPCGDRNCTESEMIVCNRCLLLERFTK